MAHKFRILIVLFALVHLGIFLFTLGSEQLYKRGAQAEAKLMMGYLHTLERVYRLENRKYVSWETLYGANQKGEDRCEQPESAAELGFLLPGCHKEASPPPRYAYRVAELTPDRYRIEAHAGSDKLGQSVVCFNTSGDEIWESSQSLEYKLAKSCL